MQQVSKTGVLLDTRPQDEKDKDFLHEEIAMGFEEYKWEERPFKDRYYFPYDQSTSLSCVSGGGAITLEHFDGEVISRKDIYNGRINYPSGGMMLSDVNDKIRRGACAEHLLPSQGLGENKMNERYTITSEIIKSRNKNKIQNTITIQKPTIDELAKITKISPIIAFWYFDENGVEWWNTRPSIKYSFKSHVDKGVTRHQVAIVDAILEDGKKYLVGQDTAGVGTGLGRDKNLRLISEEMIKRLYACSYAIDDDSDVLQKVKNDMQKPRYKNIKTLFVGSTGAEVKMLQEVLIYEGFLKIKAPTGVFGGMTRKAVIELQNKYKNDILIPSGLKSGTGYVGTKTNEFLNKKYA